MYYRYIDVQGLCTTLGIVRTKVCKAAGKSRLFETYVEAITRDCSPPVLVCTNVKGVVWWWERQTKREWEGCVYTYGLEANLRPVRHHVAEQLDSFNLQTRSTPTPNPQSDTTTSSTTTTTETTTFRVCNINEEAEVATSFPKHRCAFLSLVLLFLLPDPSDYSWYLNVNDLSTSNSKLWSYSRNSSIMATFFIFLLRPLSSWQEI